MAIFYHGGNIMKKTIISVCAFLGLFGFVVSSALAQTWAWQHAPVLDPTTEITELTANPATDLLYGLTGGNVMPITTGVITTTGDKLDPPIALSNFSDIAGGFQGAVYAITDTAVASCAPPAPCNLIAEQPIVPSGTAGIFKHIAAGKDGKLFILYEDGADHYILAGNPFAVTITAEVKITPQSLNLGSNGNWVSCRIGLPDGYEVKDVDLDSICITAIDGDGAVPGLPICRDPGSPSSAGRTLMVKFSRGALASALTDAGASDSVTLTVSGAGIAGIEAFKFSGNDTIKIKAAKEKKEKNPKKK
jgi:hypothetical protein